MALRPRSARHEISWRQIVKLAFLGLGVMGFPMAGHLARAGHEVTVYNRSAAKAAKWVETYGGKSAETPAASRAGRRARDDVRRQRRRRAGGGRRQRRCAVRHGARRDSRRPHDGVGGSGARDLRGREGAGRRLSRRSGVGRPGGRRERQAHDHGRRRGRRLRARGSRARDLRPRGDADGRRGQRPAHQDGEPDLHRGTRARRCRKASISRCAPDSIRRSSST